MIEYSLLTGMEEKKAAIEACDAAFPNPVSRRPQYETLLAVSPECQKMGIGVELMKAALNLAKSRGMKSVKLEVKKENLRAIRLYERLGFARICDAGDNSIYMINYLDEN